MSTITNDLDRMTKQQGRLPIHGRIMTAIARFFAPSLERIWRHRLERTTNYLAETSVMLIDVRDVLHNILHAPSDKVRHARMTKEGHRLIKEIDKLTGRIMRDLSQEEAAARELRDPESRP